MNQNYLKKVRLDKLPQLPLEGKIDLTYLVQRKRKKNFHWKK